MSKNPDVALPETTKTSRLFQPMIFYTPPQKSTSLPMAKVAYNLTKINLIRAIGGFPTQMNVEPPAKLAGHTNVTRKNRHTR